MRWLLSSAFFFGAAMTMHADTFVYVSMAPEKKIQIYRLDPKDGKLTPTGALDVEGSPGALCVDPDKKFLFASLRTIDSLASYAIDPATGKLKHINTVLREKGGNAAYVNYHAGHRALYSASYMAGNWSKHEVTDDGQIAKQPRYMLKTRKTAHAVVFSPDGQWFFVPHVESNEIQQFRRETDGFVLVEEAKGGSAKAGPRHLAFHPTLPMAYSSDESGSSVTAYSFNKATGLRPVQTLSTLPAGFKGQNTTAEVKVHPNGKFVWVSNRGHESLAGFAIDAKGSLTAIGQTPTEKTPRSFEIEPDGRWMFGAGEGSGKLAVFSVDTDSGKLKREHTVDVGKSVTWVMAVKMK
jgi:6-phosphogluconolactonase